MGIFQQMFGRKSDVVSIASAQTPPRTIVVAATNDDGSVMTFNDKSITFTGDLTNYDFDAILRDKQRNIVSLFE